MALKVKKEAPAPPKVKTKVKALKAKKAALKGIHSHKSNLHITHLPSAQNPVAPEAA